MRFTLALLCVLLSVPVAAHAVASDEPLPTLPLAQPGMPLPQTPACIPVEIVQRLLQDPPYAHATTLLLWTSGGLAMADISRSMYEIGAGHAYEANPMMAPFAQHPERFAAAKFAGYSAISGYLYWLRTRNPKAAFWGAVVYNLVGTAIVVHNYRRAQ